MMFLVLCKDNDIGQKNDKKNERLIEQRNLFFSCLLYFTLFCFGFPFQNLSLSVIKPYALVKLNLYVLVGFDVDCVFVIYCIIAVY